MSGFSSVPKMIQSRSVGVSPSRASGLPPVPVSSLNPFASATDLTNGTPNTIAIDDGMARLQRSTLADTFDSGILDPAWTKYETNGLIHMNGGGGSAFIRMKDDLARIQDADFQSSFMYQIESDATFDVDGVITVAKFNTNYANVALMASIHSDAAPRQWVSIGITSVDGTNRIEAHKTTASLTSTHAITGAYPSSTVYARLTGTFAGGSWTFTFYYKQNPGDPWTQLGGTHAHASIGSPIRVGWVHRNTNSADHHALTALGPCNGFPAGAETWANFDAWTVQNPNSTHRWINNANQLWFLSDDTQNTVYPNTWTGPMIGRQTTETTWAVWGKYSTIIIGPGVSGNPVDDVRATLGVKKPAVNKGFVIRWLVRTRTTDNKQILSCNNNGTDVASVNIDPVTSLWLRLERHPNDVYSGWYRILETDSWTFLGASQNVDVGGTAEVILGYGNNITADPFTIVAVDDIRGGLYPAVAKTAKSKIVTPGAAISRVSSIRVAADLGGGTGTGQLFYGARGGGSPGTTQPPVVLATGVTELLAVPLEGDYEWQVQYSLASVTGIEDPAVDSEASAYI